MQTYVFDKGECLEKLLVCEIVVAVLLYALMMSSVYSPFEKECVGV